MEAQREGICALILLESTIFSREASFYVFLTWDRSVMLTQVCKTVLICANALAFLESQVSSSEYLTQYAFNKW